MSAQLESLERSQIHTREVPVPPENELIVSEEPQPESESEPEMRDDPPRYENTSWD